MALSIDVPITIAIKVTANNSVINCVATLCFFIPIAVRTPISYFLSRRLKMLNTTRIIPPIASTIKKNQPAIVLNVFRGVKLFS